MSSLKVVNGIIHHVYYDPVIQNNRTKSWKLPDNPQGWKQAEKKLKEYEAKKALGVDMYATKKPVVTGVNLTLSALKEEYFKAKNTKTSSRNGYSYATAKLIDAIGDLYIWLISENEHKYFMEYLDRAKKTNHKIKKDPVTKEITTESIPVDKPLSEHTKGSITRHLAILFNFAKSQGWVKENYFREIWVQKKRARRIPVAIVRDVLAFMKAKPNKEHFYVVLTMLISGFRKSTICALTWDRIDFTENIIRVPNIKGGRDDDFPMPGILKRVLLLQQALNKQYPNNKVFVFKSRFSFGFWNMGLKKLGLPDYTVHQMRKTFVSVLGNAGMRIDDVSFLAGHKDRRTTEESYLEFEYKRLQTEMDEAFSREFGDLI